MEKLKIEIGCVLIKIFSDIYSSNLIFQTIRFVFHVGESVKLLQKSSVKYSIKNSTEHNFIRTF